MYLYFRAAAGSFGVEIPLHVNELKDIQPQLMALVTVYGIDAVRCNFYKTSYNHEQMSRHLNYFIVIAVLFL